MLSTGMIALNYFEIYELENGFFVEIGKPNCVSIGIYRKTQEEMADFIFEFVLKKMHSAMQKSK